MATRKKTPQPHQTEALEDIRAGLAKHHRGQVHMACGTGKSLVALWAAEQSGAKRIVVFVPALALIDQLLRAWRESCSWDWRVMVVCSDETIADDEMLVDPDSFGCPVTMEPQEVSRFLSGGGVRVVFCTYHSAHLLNGLEFDLGVFDEAHRTSGYGHRPFSVPLHDDGVPIRKRLFFTATPRVVLRGKTKWRTVFSMDDKKTYGPVFHSLSFRNAVQRGLVCDYKIIISEVSEGEASGDRATQVAIDKAMRRYGINKAFTFHGRVTDAKSFASTAELKDTKLFHVNGGQPMSLRAKTLDSFAASKRALITNARCLTEGVDVPSVGMVCFVQPRKALVDIVQAVGRACRLSPGKTTGYVFLPVFRRTSEGETVEQAMERSQFRAVLDVLQAMASQDEALAETIKKMAIAKARGQQGESDFTNVDFMPSMGADVSALRRIVTASIVSIIGGERDTESKQAALLAMAREGKPRPSLLEHKTRRLAVALTTYQRTAPDFIRGLKKIAPPGWFMTADKTRLILLERARRGLAKPKDSPLETNEERNLARRLVYYQRDPTFVAELARIAPEWIVTRRKPFAWARKGADETKARLLALAKSGAPRPSKKSTDPDELRNGRLLHNYTVPSSTSYDPEFKAQIEAAGWSPRPIGRPKNRALLKGTP